MKRTRLAAIGAVGAMAVASLAAGLSPAVAQDAAQTEEAPTTGGSTRDGTRAERRTERQAALAAALAEELDLPEERVAAALTTVHERFRTEAQARRLETLRERLDAAVTDGRLTREQADAVLAAAESDVLPLGHDGPGRRAHPRRFGDNRSE